MPRISQEIENIFRLGIKELYSLARDPVLVFLIVWTFTAAIYSVATGVQTEVRNASIAIADEDRSELSQRLRAAFLPPYFKPPVVISIGDIDRALDAGRYAFVLVVPPGFERDVLAGRVPTLQLAVDATAMTLAGNGTRYIQAIVQDEIARFVDRGAGAAVALPVSLTIRARFNPNLESSWFTAIMQLVNNVTMLSLILVGAAVIREREHGTIEHLLVMPVMPVEIMIAKIWANGLVIVAAAIISLIAVVQGVLGVVTHGSIVLFATGTSIFLFSMMALGITLSTIARSMPQFGLLSIPFFVVMNMLSGGVSPLEAMPVALQVIMRLAPSSHYTSFAQAVLYRGAGLDIVWPEMVAMVVIGALLFALALSRFRRSMSAG